MNTPHGHEPSDSTDGVADKPATRTAILRALSRLSADHRHVIVECYIRGVQTADVAAALGIPHDTVKSRTYYALRAFGEALESVEGTK